MSQSSTLSPAPVAGTRDTSRHGGAPLLVIGAGPKAVALAVKSSVLRAAGFDVPEVVAVERDRTAANWLAGRGWTNGRQRLGTLPEKDLGFPYDCTTWGEPQDPVTGEIAQRMAGFSWAGHLQDRGLYARWIDRGRPQPSHREWADYLQWAADRSGLRTVPGEVRAAELRDGTWTLTVEDGAEHHAVHGRGLLVSGPGPAAGAVPADGTRVLDTAGFWKLAVEGFPDWARTVIVVGAGETAGTIVRELALGQDRKVTVVAPRATLYSRGESPFENRYYSDPTGWAGLSEADRQEFIRRTDRAVFSQEVQSDLALTSNVSWEPGRVIGTRPADGQVAVEIAYGERHLVHRADLVVDATGGDALWFTGLLGPRAEDALRDALGGAVTRERIERSIDASLAVPGLPAPLHLPNLAALAQGPGFPNLSSLGLLSDRVLARYVPGVPTDDRAAAGARSGGRTAATATAHGLNHMDTWGAVQR
ncbi:SidA/IucD/PvdA family monooxygenase [Streptomyces griseocarneus]|uniref:SidA/IucD/PvdA family monooxygenase n=1 Tax=Streptomyces griseocarneus TaxID=51201 RepID=UPI00167D7827|nr:SidA/IucD/PvdA family monooxygenase [Streptomyces griseocarneus]MBZ6477494.1 SidA/IucD/PvdA family monooxygenase [Streptomyces griseocarneus]GHG49306.1 lysine 6-monooxygenase [Streptomyces griseocarneus]